VVWFKAMPVKMIQKTDNANNSITRIEEAYREIKQMIFDQKLIPGQRLVNQDLVERLNMSRTPIINALNRLVQDGLVAFESFRGFYVRSIDLKEVWDAFGVREALEVYTVEQAIKLSGSNDMQLLEDKLREHADYQPHYYTRKKFLLDSEFHIQIAAMTKNNVLKWLLKRNFEHIYLRARLENYDIQRMTIAVDEHSRLVRKMKNKDIIGSIELMRIHIQKARDLVIRSLSDDESDNDNSTNV
jgi:DNA-binding GntR family transcriptional regulator